MKKYKGIIAVLMAFVIVCTLVACSSQGGNEETSEITQAVTDENGELVTDENGEVVTEAVEGEVVTDANGEAVTEVVTAKNGEAVTNSNGKKVVQYVTAAPSSGSKTTKKSDKSTTKKSDDTTKADNTSTTKKPISKPKAPANVSSLKASDIEPDSVKLSWSKVDCTGYQIAMSSNNGGTWKTIESAYTKGTTYTVKNLTSMTDYNFRVRAYNKNSAGTTASAWKDVKVTTAESDTSRKLTFTFVLPNNNGIEDTLTIKIDGKVVDTVTVKCDGSEYKYTTEKKYKGAVDVVATLKKSNASRAVRTDKDVRIDLSVTGIDVLEAEDD
ncbi:MAG: fibronectin type III domain-containing protein [Eubacterium sp.]